MTPTLSAAVVESERLVLRKARDADRDGLVEVLTDPEVRAYLGGARPRADVERFFDQFGTASATAQPGSYVIADRRTDRLVGILGLGRRAADVPGHVTSEGGELELSYVLRRDAWGAGFAFEAATAALRAAARELSDQPVLVVTQTANHRSRKLSDRLGFEEVDTFEQHDAQQTLAVASLGVFRAGTDLFSRSWTALRAAVAGLQDQDFERPSGCTGWLVRDLVCHLVIDAQDVLITLVTPAETEPTRDAVTYWDVVEPPTGDDPLDALTVRLAAAYEEPWLLKFHLDDIGSAAGRAAELADPDVRVSTRDQVLTVGDYLSAYVLEWTLHHLDLTAHLPDAPEPPTESMARSREMLEKIAGAPFPTSLSDRDVLLVGTGRRAPTAAEQAELGELGTKLPFALG